MKTERTKVEQVCYICEVCGYSQIGKDCKNEILKHEREHKQDKPFRIGQWVSWNKAFTMSDHGKPYEYSERVLGKIISIGNAYALIELSDGTRERVGIWGLSAKDKTK